MKFRTQRYGCSFRRIDLKLSIINNPHLLVYWNPQENNATPGYFATTLSYVLARSYSQHISQREVRQVGKGNTKEWFFMDQNRPMCEDGEEENLKRPLGVWHSLLNGPWAGHSYCGLGCLMEALMTTEQRRYSGRGGEWGCNLTWS